VEPLVSQPDIDVFVVDNASPDGSLSAVEHLSVTRVALDRNYGFAYGCNRGWERGSGAAVLFLNPDARIAADSVRRLAAVLGTAPEVGLVAPKIFGEDGSVELSLRRFPRLRSTYARALFLHRLFPHASWSDEIVRDAAAYERPHGAEWVSGACVLVRRAALERVGGWDEGFFLYSEDVDLCRRLREAGFEVRYEPSATATHLGGASAPRASLFPLLAASRIRYARIHSRPAAALLERIGVAIGELTHAALTTKGHGARRGHLEALRVACSRTERETASV